MSLPDGAVHVLSPSLFCPPRWLGDVLWVARGSKDSFNRVEIDHEESQLLSWDGLTEWKTGP
jgi:hypothetical protein